jgi:hypothetical protein
LSMERRDDLVMQLEAHISHIRHLSIIGHYLPSVFNRLVVPSAPTLEFLSLSYEPFPWWPRHPRHHPRS